MEIEMKRCTCCKQELDIGEFSSDASRWDNLNATCSNCVKKRRRTKQGMIKKIYRTQIASSRKRGETLPAYTRQELETWLYAQALFHLLYTNWVKFGYQKRHRPSVDRISDFVSYTMENIQLMTFQQNVEKSGREHKNGTGRGPGTPVIQWTLGGCKVKEFRTSSEAGRDLNIDPSSIIKCANNKSKTAGGFLWKYK